VNAGTGAEDGGRTAGKHSPMERVMENVRAQAIDRPCGGAATELIVDNNIG
jgi:hypothetical protein